MSWDSGLRVLHDCKCLCVPRVIEILIDPETYQVIEYVRSKVDSNEFLIYLTAYEVERSGEKVVYYVKDWYIPKQKVTSTSVNVEESDVVLKFNTVLHYHPFSHGNSSFSSTDYEYVNSNHMISLLLDRSGITRATIQFKPPCSKDVIFMVEIGKENIKIGKPMNEELKNKLDELIRERIEVQQIYYPQVYGYQTYTQCPYIGRESECPVKNYYRCNYISNTCPYRNVSTNQVIHVNFQQNQTITNKNIEETSKKKRKRKVKEIDEETEEMNDEEIERLIRHFIYEYEYE